MRACRPIGALAAAAASAILVLAATGLPARAGAEAEHVRIQLSAPKGCPDAAAFIRAVRQRTARFRLAGGSDEVRTLVATITPAGSAFSGRLVTQSLGREISERTVSGKTCDDVMAVLAFMTALAIDPSFSRPTDSPPPPQPARPLAPPIPSPQTTSAAEPSALGTGQAGASPSQQPISRTTPSPSIAAAPRPEKSPGPPPSRVSPPRSEIPSVGLAPRLAVAPGGTASSRWNWSAGAHGGASLGLSPTTGFGGLLFVEAAAPGTTVLGPVLRTGLFVNRSREALANGAAAEFQWIAALAEGCPMRLFVARPSLALHACVAFHLGALRAQGRSLERAEQTTDLWADLGPVARARVALSERLFMEAQAMLVVPLRRISYDVYYTGLSGSSTTVHAVPWLGALLGIGVAYQFQ
jgi:hypothetical protein